MKILFISFLFEPDTSVGAKRISYWAQNFKKHQPSSKVYVITSTENPIEIGIDKMITVKSQPIPSFTLIKDQGYSWKTQIVKAIEQSDIKEITHVVMSGGPFMYFELGKFFREKYAAKIILDYRDPFAINPRFQNSQMKIMMKQFFERKFNKAADLIISVNRYCIELLAGHKEYPSKFTIIPNGFNEKFLPEIIKREPQVQKKLVYAGSFYSNSEPQIVVDTIAECKDWELHHLGRPSDFINKNNKFIEHGMKSYEEMMRFVGDCDATLIVTSGDSFESTTKIYDYIAMQRPIIVITRGKLKTGAIYDELKDYPTVWCKNNKEDIQRALKKVKEIEVGKLDVNQYSREAGLEKLIQSLKDL